MFAKNGHIYCRHDYLQRFAKRCASCNKPIDGQFITATGRNFHPRCFVCSRCRHQTRTERDEGFHVRAGSVLCRGCFMQVAAPKCSTCGVPLTHYTEDPETGDKFCQRHGPRCDACRRPLGAAPFVKMSDGRTVCVTCRNKPTMLQRAAPRGASRTTNRASRQRSAPISAATAAGSPTASDGELTDDDILAATAAISAQPPGSGAHRCAEAAHSVGRPGRAAELHAGGTRAPVGRTLAPTDETRGSPGGAPHTPRRLHAAVRDAAAHYGVEDDDDDAEFATAVALAVEESVKLAAAERHQPERRALHEEAHLARPLTPEAPPHAPRLRAGASAIAHGSRSASLRSRVDGATGRNDTHMARQRPSTGGERHRSKPSTPPTRRPRTGGHARAGRAGGLSRAGGSMTTTASLSATATGLAGDTDESAGNSDFRAWLAQRRAAATRTEEVRPTPAPAAAIAARQRAVEEAREALKRGNTAEVDITFADPSAFKFGPDGELLPVTPPTDAVRDDANVDDAEEDVEVEPEQARVSRELGIEWIRPVESWDRGETTPNPVRVVDAAPRRNAQGPTAPRSRPRSEGVRRARNAVPAAAPTSHAHGGAGHVHEAHGSAPVQNDAALARRLAAEELQHAEGAGEPRAAAPPPRVLRSALKGGRARAKNSHMHISVTSAAGASARRRAAGPSPSSATPSPRVSPHVRFQLSERGRDALRESIDAGHGRDEPVLHPSEGVAQDAAAALAQMDAAEEQRLAEPPSPEAVFDTNDFSYENLLLLDYNRNRRGEGLELDKLLRIPSIVCAGRGEDCRVCLEVFDRGEKALLLPCKHRFHAQCVGKWFHSAKSCPVCRKDVG